MFLGIYGENRLQHAAVNIVYTCNVYVFNLLLNYTEDHMLDKQFYLICNPLKIKILLL